MSAVASPMKERYAPPPPPSGGPGAHATQPTASRRSRHHPRLPTHRVSQCPSRGQCPNREAPVAPPREEQPAKPSDDDTEVRRHGVGAGRCRRMPRWQPPVEEKPCRPAPEAAPSKPTLTERVGSPWRSEKPAAGRPDFVDRHPQAWCDQPSPTPSISPRGRNLRRRSC